MLVCRCVHALDKWRDFMIINCGYEQHQYGMKVTCNNSIRAILGSEIGLCRKQGCILSRVHNNKSVQLPCGIHYHHLCSMTWQTVHVVNMYIGCVNSVVITMLLLLHHCLLTSYCRDGGNWYHMAVAPLNSWCYELLILWIICAGWELYKTFTAEDTTLAQKAVWNNQQTTL